MNFVGKFDAKLPIDGSGTHPAAHQHIDSVSSTHAPSDAIIVPDADLLFNGDFKRSGVDLIVSRDDHELVVPDYFKGEKRAALASPDGAKLTGDIVNALAGHVEIAQADGSAGAGKVIGHVTKLTGTATAIRNGVSIILNQGDNVEKGDVVQSGSNSTLGVTFIDGTVFGLSANARMVLNEMVYDPNGSSNSSLISLVAGTISFVAGQTAKHGDMKIDTPVATMGIRGTAVLVEIDFDVPGHNGTPEAKFQVLVEPDGTTGSYILFDKNTLAPIAVVDKAGQQVHISDNNVSFSNSPLTPELQKLITDVFTLKFSNTNPQSLTHFTDTLIPQQMWLPVQLANGGPPTVVHVVITPIISESGTSSAPPPSAIPHINQPPVVTTIDASLTERAHLTGSSAVDSASGTIGFFDINLGDRPTAKATISSFTYQDAQHQDIAASPQELADIHALEAIPLVMVQAPGNTYKGAATWTLHVPDKAFDFLGAGDTLTLTYTAEVDSNYGGGNLAGFANFTVTITGTNDAPVITTAAENVAFVNVGTSTTGPNLPVDPTTTTNTLKFKDVDLTDTHTVTADLTGATLSETGGQTLDMQALETKFPRPMDVFESALSAAVTTDSTGTGTGTITWTLADISSYYADIVPKGETLTLTYTVTVKDSQGATSSQTVTVTITGSDAPAVVWVETTATSANDAAPGDWNGAGNWETGTVPTASDDVIIITNQLQGQTPLYPVTIKSVADGGVAAAAHSLTMNDYGTPFTNSPTLINNNTLTVGAGGISLSADAILENFGTLTLGGLLEVLQESSLQNNIGALITLHDGGDFNNSGSFTDSNDVVHSGSVTNAGTIDLAGGTLNVEVAVANAGGTIQIDPGATLKLNGSAIDGGTIIDNSTIDVTGNSKIDSGAALNNGAATVENGATLTLDSMTVNGTAITDKGTIVLDKTVQLTGGATLEGASSLALGVITNNGTLEVSGAASLLNDTLTNTSGIIQIDDSQILTLSGTVIIGGIINDFSGAVGGKIDVTGNSQIDSGATLHNGGATVENGATLTLDGMTVNGSTITDKGTIVLDKTVQLTGGAILQGLSNLALGAITNNGTLEVAGAASLLNDILTNTSGIIQVDGSRILTLSGTEIIGGIINDNSTIDVAGNSKIDGSATLNNGFVTVESGMTLTLDDVTVNGTTFTDIVTGGTIQIDSGHTLTFNGATINGGTLTINGELDSTGNSFITDATIVNSSHIDVVSGTLTIDPTPVTNTGTIEVEGQSTLVLSGETITNSANGVSGTIQVDATDATHFAILDLAGSTITGGKLIIAGDLVSTGDSFINGAAITNTGTIDVTGGTLTIDAASTIDNSTGTIETHGGHLIIDAALSGNIEIKGAATVELGASAPTAYSAATVTFDFGSTGTLTLDHSQDFHGTISGFNAGVTIDLADIVYSATVTDSWDSTTGTLTISDGTHSAALKFSGGTYDQDSFALTSDANGDTEVVSSPAQASLSGLDSAHNAVEGSVVTATLTDANPGTVTYQWLDDGVAIANATNASYTPTANDLGHVLDVVVGFTVGGTAEHITAVAGTVAAPTITITVDTPDGLDFHNHDPLAEMGSGTIQSGGTSTSFTIVDSADNLEFVLDGNNLAYGSDGNGGITVTGGTLTSFHELTNDAKPVALADFTGLSVDAAIWITDVQLAATGDHSAIDKLTSTFAYNFVGGSGPDSFGAAGQADTLSGTGVDVFDGGGAPAGSHDTLTGGAGSTFVFQQGYGALTITNFDQDSGGNFVSGENDQIQLNGLTAPTAQNVSYANGNAILDFGNGDVVTLLHVTQAEYEGLGGAEFSTGNGGGNSNGPVIDNANNIVTYAGMPVFLDPSITVSDTTGTVTSVNAWISAGAQSGDTLTINGEVDGTIAASDGSIIHYHFDGNAIELEEGSGSSGIPTLADFDATLQLIEFSPGAADGARTITWAAHEAVNTSPTVTTTVEVGPILNSVALTVSQGGTDVLTPGDFSVTHAQSTDFYSVQNVTGGQFEVFNGTNWVSAPTGGFNDLQILQGHVEFVQDGTATTPNFSISVSDDTNVSPAIAPTVNFTPTLTIADGATYNISAPTSEVVTFAGSTGTLELTQPTTFTGKIAGMSGADALDLPGFAGLTTTAVTGSGSYHADTGTTTLTVTDGSDSKTETFTLVGDYSNSTWTVANDGKNGVTIVDPPAPASPGATSTIVASAPNQVLTGTAASDTFVFNFANLGNATVTNFHAETDVIQFSSQLFLNVQAALNATHDDGHGNTVIAVDAHDTITLNGILKAQLQAGDFHFV